MRIWLLTLTILASSQAQAAQNWGNVQGWDVFEDDDKSYCAMIMSYEGKGSTELSYAIKPDSSTLMVVTNYGWSAEKDKEYKFALEFDKYIYDVTAIGIGGGSPRGFGLGFDAENGSIITSEISSSSGLRIYMGDELVDDLSLKGTSAAVARVRSCVTKIKRELDAEAKEKARLAHISDDPFTKKKEPEAGAIVDSSAILSKAQPVKMANSGYILSSDYPAKALSQGIGGKVEILLTVNEFAQVSKCKIVTSSGNLELDDETCKVAAKRMKFSAATDDSGKAIEGTILRSITWRPPPPEPPPPPPPPKLEIER